MEGLEEIGLGCFSSKKVKNYPSDAVILKAITPPSMDEFKDLLKAARTSAKKAGLTESDLKTAIKKVLKP